MLRSLASKLADTLADGGWRAKARPEQLLPDGDDWNGVAYISGRGWGKTRTGSEGIKESVEAGRAKRIALVAPTAARCARYHGGRRERHPCRIFRLVPSDL